MNTAARTWFDLGEAYWSLSWYEQAIESYQEALCADPDCTEAWHKLAQVHERMGRIDKSIEVLKQGIQANPGDFMLWRALGICHHRRREIMKVREVLVELRRLDPDLADVFYEQFVRRINSWW